MIHEMRLDGELSREFVLREYPYQKVVYHESLNNAGIARIIHFD